ncbi:MAG: hypothetical protein U0936_21065 [Planctomycetaceae bacterium]
MSCYAPQTQFSGKTWIFLVQALVFGGFALVSLTLGPLFLFEIMKDARGQPARDAGVALTVMSIPLLLVFALAVFNIVARRRPLISLYREGLAINMIGSSSLDGIPLIPGMLRVAWLILSLEGFRQQMLFAPWQSLKLTHVYGLPMMRQLTIAGSIFRSTDGDVANSAALAQQVTIPEVAFDESLDQIAATINAYCQNSELRNQLSSLNGAPPLRPS